MNTSRCALLRACLLVAAPFTAYAQTEPVIFEAEDTTIAVLGSAMQVATDAAGVTYVTTTINETNPPSPTTQFKVNRYTVTFPAPGNYELFARYLVGPGGGNDDSWYYGQGFDNSSAWSLLNSGQIGFTAANQTVYPGGTVGSNVFRWVKVTGGAGQFPTVWTVPAGQLTQTFYWATREDGMLMDKFAFGRQGSWYTVHDLDTGGPATGIEPPTPPPVPPAYTRVGAPLATAYAPKFLGSAWSPGNASLNFGAYWNQVTPENAGKWGSVEGTRDVYNFVQAHQAYDQAVNNGQVFKWHVLFWGNQQPNWMYDLSSAEQLEEIHEWLGAIAAEFPNLEQIEVVNEPLHDPPDRTSAGNTTAGGGSGGYVDALGGAANDQWIITAFELARQYFPHAKLMMNDYSITNDGNATTRYLAIIDKLKARGLIDLVGVQAHAFEFGGGNPAATHKANLDRLAAAGLPIYATELDIDGVDAIFGVQDDALQLARFQQLFPVFWEHEAVKGVTLWGYVQNSHWRTNTGAWLMYPNGAERPALQWLVRYMENRLAVVGPGQSFNVSENAAGGTAIGNVLATDTDPGTTLSQWQMTDPSGKFAIDANTGALSLVPGATLDFETGTSYFVSVSVWDGYMRSAAESVAVKVINQNDNVPEITAGQVFDIDGGAHNIVGAFESSDPDDLNEIGFTTFQDWKIVGGNPGSIFKLRPDTGELKVARPLHIDWRKTSYSVLATVGDGLNTSAAQGVVVSIPRRLDMCFADIIRLEVPKATAPLILLLGGELGSCTL
jgi:endo-1,4-beta-xylanase